LRGRPLFRKKEASPAPPPEKPKLNLDMIAAAPAEPEVVAAAPAEPEAVAAAPAEPEAVAAAQVRRIFRSCGSSSNPAFRFWQRVVRFDDLSGH